MGAWSWGSGCSHSHQGAGQINLPQISGNALARVRRPGGGGLLVRADAQNTPSHRQPHNSSNLSPLELGGAQAEDPPRVLVLACFCFGTRRGVRLEDSSPSQALVERGFVAL